ncbi:hypothetical protein CLTEP_04760 [Clostridium tepidiprofundi DSM 19306]|uniref:Uncharacterized protein n=1 Tax=Clostridium tepidiprofundi DSM 19306 TaxID=1121338 RepID=A0A151B7B4_9CLOT|nr:DUF58 domain-containing protein [Clostridium tepidiprofundi]KYH35537.1 hypothetical protein CLTEP_04760 [Clostridium tepidiprofundi DSM 19306]
MSYFVLFLIVVALIFDRLSQKFALYNLNSNRIITKNLVEIGDEFDIIVTLENNKILPVTFVQFVEKFPKDIVYKLKANITNASEEIYHTSTLSVLPFQRVQRKYRVYFTKRGRYFMNDVDLKAGDFLGFKTFSKKIKFDNEIIVLPKKIALNKLIEPRGSTNGDISVKRWIMDDPTLIVGIREYTGFEPQKNIHWPSSLKSGKLMVKQFDYTSDNSAMIILNIETYRPLWLKIDSNKIEKCISLARTIIDDFEDENIPYGFITNAQSENNKDISKEAYICSNPQHHNTILKSLGKIVYNVEISFNELLDNIINSYCNCGTYVIITPIIFEEDINYINNLSNLENKVILITLSDKNINYISNNILTYVEGGNML